MNQSIAAEVRAEATAVELEVVKKASTAISAEGKRLSFKAQVALETGLEGKELTLEWQKRCRGHGPAVMGYVQAKQQEGFIFDAPRENIKGNRVTISMFKPKTSSTDKATLAEELTTMVKQYPNLTINELIVLLKTPKNDRPQA